MGQAVAKLSTDGQNLILLEETAIFSSWTIADVKELAKRFRNQVFGYALVETQFESIMSFKKDEITKIISLESLFEILDNDNDGRIDGLELLAGLNLCCRAEFEEKAKFCFELFDFNLNASLSEKELVVMLMANVCGLNLLIGGGEDAEPKLETFEDLARKAFIRADTDRSGMIQYGEFVVWARSNRDIINFIESLSKMYKNHYNEYSDDSAKETDVDEDDLNENPSSDEDDNEDFKNRHHPRHSKQDSIIQWKTQLFPPLNVSSAATDSKDGPQTNMELAWVHGISTTRGRGNLRYAVSDSRPDNLDTIVYHSANLGIVYNKKTKMQYFYDGHSAEITCMSIHPSGRIIATADVTSKIHLWDALSPPPILQCIATFSGMVKNGIRCIEFSPDGERLATIGNDIDRTLAIIDYASGEIVSSAKGLSKPNIVNDLAYSASGNEICIVGKKKIKFFVNIKSKRRALESVSGKIGHEGKKQLFLCVRYIGEDAIVGCASGELYKFSNAICVQIVKAFGFNEPVSAIYYNVKDATLITGSKSGYIKTWGDDLKENGNSIDLSEDLDGDGKADNGGLNNEVISIQIIEKNILIATRGSDVFEAIIPVNSNEQVELSRHVWGHSYGELWGLACHPHRDEFASCGDDKTLRIWSFRSHEQIQWRALPNPSRCVAYNQGGTLLCLGMEDGSVAILNSVNLRVLSTWTHSSQAITDVKFSPDNSYLVVASKDSNIYIYRKGEEMGVYNRHAVCRGHISAVLHIDISLNNKYIQSNSEDLSLLFWDMQGNLVRSPSSICSERWFTYTCPLNWSVQGIHSDDSNSRVICCQGLPEVSVVLSGDNKGNVSLFQYPSLDKSAIKQTYGGHSRAVTSVRFKHNNRQVVSIGGHDRAILLWHHDAEEVDSDVDDASDTKSEMSLVDGSGHVIAEFGNDVFRNEIADVGNRTILQEAVNADRSAQELADIVKSMKESQTEKVLQWREAVYEPENWLTDMRDRNPNYSPDGSTDVDLQLKWVHGYRAHDCRNNLRYNAAGDIVYHAATLGIVYSKQSGSQKFLHGAHSDDILGIAAHPAGQIFATGEAGRNPNIIVWNSENLHSLARIGNAHTRGIPLLAFNDKGNLLASIGLDSDHTLVVHEWEKGIALCQTPTDKRTILCMCFLMQPNASKLSPQQLNGNENLPPDTIVTGGVKHIKFWWSCGQNMKSQRGIWGTIGKRFESEKHRPTMLAVASASPNICVTGSTDGQLFVWKNFRLVSISNKIAEKNNSAIQTIWCKRSTNIDCNDCSGAVYITGDKSGDIIVWAMKHPNKDPQIINLEPTIKIDNKPKLNILNCSMLGNQTTPPRSFPPINSSVRSICVSEQKKSMLIGTQAGEIYELPYEYDCDIETFVNLTTDIVCGHGGGELRGLWAHDSKPIYWTAGDDKTLRSWTWTNTEHKMTSMIKLSDKCRTVCHNSVTEHLAAGLNNGKVSVFKVNTTEETKQSEKKRRNSTFAAPPSVEKNELPVAEFLHGDASDIIHVVKYNDHGSILAIGSGNSNIYILRLKDEKTGYQYLGKCSGHSGAVTHIDFAEKSSNDNKIEIVLQSASSTGELYFWNIGQETANFTAPLIFTRISSANSVKDLKWESYSCPYGWPVQGIWPFESDGCNVNAVCRSNSWETVPVVLVGDTYGRVRLYNYPSLIPGAPDKTYKGHSHNVTNVAFTYKDEYCVTIGGNDNCVFVWSTDIAEELQERKAMETTQLQSKLKSISKISTDVRNANFDESVSQIGLEEEEEEDAIVDGGMVSKDEKPSGGDQFMATKAWLGAVREPSNYVEPADSNEPPNATLELNYVYGYRGWDCRNNVGFADSSYEIVYHVAGVGVVLNTIDNTQIHNVEHSDDILSLDVHPLGHCVVTGEIGPHPKLVIWDANTGVTLKSILFHKKGICCVKFTTDGANIVSVGMDTDRVVAVHNSVTGVIVGSGKIGRGVEVYVVAVSGNNTFATGGKDHIKFWDIAKDQSVGRVELCSKRGLFVAEVKSKTVVSAAYLGNDCVTGMSDGALLLWKGRTCTKIENKAHLGAVTSMNHVPLGMATGSGDIGPRILSGGNDGCIHIWNIQLTRVWSLDVKQLSPSSYSPSPSIQAIACKEGKLLIGTKTSEIFEYNVLSNEVLKRVDGHFGARSEVCGVDKHPKKLLFATASDDATVRVWDSKLKRQIKIAQIDTGGRTVSYSLPDGDQIAVGCKNGRIKVFRNDLSEMLCDVTVSRDWIQDTTYSPNGSLLAVGSHDMSIFLLETRNYSIASVCRGHHSYISHIDFSSCGNYLQSVSGDYELLFWNSNGQQIKSATAVRDIDWHTWTCTIGWPVQGIRQDAADGTDINSVDRSPDRQLLATGDDFRQLKLFRYPPIKPRAKFKKYKGHSEHVTRVRFSHNGQKIYSVGGLDKAVLQFSVTKNSS